MSENGGPPVTVIRKARWRTFAGVAISAVGLCFLAGIHGFLWVAMGREVFLDGFREEPFLSALGLVPLVVVALQLGFAIRAIWWGDTITLGRSGFRSHVRGHSRFVRWDEVKQFRVERPAASMHDVVGWDHQDDAFNGNPVWEGFRTEGERTTTLDCDLGWGWQDGAEAVCATLEAWRVRYSGEA